MEEKDKLRVLYDGVSSYMDIGNYDDFKNAMRDTSKRQKFFDGVSSYMDIGTNDQFNSFMDGYFGQQQPAQRVDVSDVEQAEQPQVPTATGGEVDNNTQNPYGDLTSENFVAAKQRGSEIAAKRKEIQRALDSDTEMEPLTMKQRNEYEQQLKALDNEMNGINAFVDEWNKTEEAKAYYDAQKRAVDDVSARVDQMQADRNRERASKKAEEEGKKSFWQRFAEGLAAAENPITEETVAAITDPTNNDLRTARNEVRNARNQLRLEEMRQNGEQRGLGFLRGMENANYYELMPAIGMADAMSILQLSKDIKDGKELTDSQKLLKEAMEARAGVDFAYQDNNTLWERIGQSAPEQLMFTLQFVIGAGVTGATSAGERLAAKSAERAAKRLAKKGATSAARNFVATRVVPELEGMAVSSAIQTFANPLSVAGMVEDFERRYAGDIYYDKEGNLHVFDNDRSAGQAAYQAIASAWIENFTEYAGGNITKSAKLLDSKMFDLAGKFDNVMKTVGAGKIQDVFRIPQQLGRLTQIGSAPEEFLEEELGSVMNALMATDAQRGESYGDAFKNTISSSFAGEQQLETFLSCAITSMLLGGGGNAVNGVRNAGLRKSVNQDVEQSKALLGKVRGIDIEGLDNLIENGRVSDISAYLKEQSDANNWNKDEQGAAVSYVLNRSRQIGVKHNDDTAIEAEQAEYRRQAEDMVNRWDGQNIYNVTYTDRNGETQEGTIVNGRVHYNTNEDGTYTFDPYMSSGMLAIRRADGSVEQVAGRNVTALNNVATIEEQLESQNQTIDQLMRAEFDQDGMLPTIESVWGGNLVPNVTQFQNGRYTYLGQDDNGLYAFANNDKRTSKDNPIVYLTERQLIEYGLSLNLENAQANGDTEAAQKAQEDIDFLKRLDEITADAGAKGQWDVVKAYAQRKVLFDANGGIIPNESNEQATAAYLLAISEGSFENAIASVDQTIAALGTPQQTEVTDNAADNAAMNNAAATVDADKARQIDFYTNVRNRLTEMQQGKEEADQEEAEQVVANTPVSQMEVGQQFPVEWRGQQAMATVMGKDADGRSVVTVRDMDGEDIEAGIDDMSDAAWEGVRVQPQSDEQAPQQEPETTPVQPAPTPQGPAPVAPTATETQPVSQNETPELAPIPTSSDVAPSMEFPRDEEGNIDYEQITDPYVYAAAVTEEFGEDALNLVDSLIEGEETILAESPKIKDAIKRFREQRNAKKRLERFKKVRDILTAPQEQAETTTEETPVEQPMAETTQETTAEEAPAEPHTSESYTEKKLVPSISPDVSLQLYIEISDKRKKSDVDQKIEEYLYYLNPKAFNLTDGQRIDKTRELVEYAKQHQDNEYAKKILDAVEYIKSPAETPTESAGEGTEQTEEPEQELEQPTEEIQEQPTEEKKPKPKKQTDFQQRLDAVGEPRSLEEAILLDIARGGAKFRWGNRDEDKTVTKRGIGDLWKYSQSEFKKRIGILRKDGYSIETYAEAIQAGQLAYLGGHVSQLAERMDMRDLVDAIEDVLHFATSATEALEAIETKRNEEAEEEQRMIRNAMDSEAKEQGFENRADKEAYIQSLEENNLTDEDYEEITRIFAEQYQEDGQRARTSESEGDSAENQPDERQGVRGADEGSTEVLQGTQAADTGPTEPAGQGTRGESGDIQDAGTPGKNEGAREVRAEIDKLKAQRANLVKQLNDIQKRYENANGLFGDTQADEEDLFGGQNFLSPELAQTTIDGYNRQIKQIDEQIAKLEASLKRASSVRQTELGVEETRPQWDYDIKIDQKTGHTTIERYTKIEGGMPIFDARWKLEADSPAEMLGIITNPRNGLNVDYFKKFIDILRSYGDRYTTKKAETKKEEPKKNEPQGAATENTIFTEDEYQRRKEALKRRHRTELNIAINPQDFEDLLYMAGYHIERGVRKFADFCKNMIEDLGDWVRPYLQTVYLGAKADDDIKKLGIDRKEWSSEDEVLDFDVDNFDKQQESETGAHQYTDQQKRMFSDAVRVDMRMALERGEKPYRSINDIRKRAESLGMEVDSDGRDDIVLQELVEDGLVRAAREVVESGRYGEAKSQELFDNICKLYEMQPTISRRSANRVKMQQYSTPLPMSFVADMFAYRRGQKSVLEPTAGNGMLVFAVPARIVTANELDETRLANLREQGFDRVLNRDATDFDFGGPFDAVIGNPPFGSAEAKEYDGVMIGGLEEQIVLNALQAMADNGRAAFIVGGNMEYAKNGGIAGNKAFWTYLYNHYNVKGVVDMDGKMYSRQGTTFPTRMILIEGRRSAEEIAQSTIYPPVKEKSLRKAESFVDLYDIVKELNDSQNKTNGNEVLRSTGQTVEPVIGGTQRETDGGRPETKPDEGNESVSGVRRGLDSGHQGVLVSEKRDDNADEGRKPAGEPEGNGEPGSGHVRPMDERMENGDDTSGSGSRHGTETNKQGGNGRDKGRSGLLDTSDDNHRASSVRGTDVLTERKQKEQGKRTLTEKKLPYRPHNGAFSLGSVAPAAMVEAMDKSLAEIEKTYGKSIDEFVTDELGYDSIEEMHNALAAEQVDSVAMAIHQMKQGNGMIIGDQTGVGKGRQMAALIRWAHKQGKKPIFFTKDADLFTDIYRDLVDVGSGDLRPFIFNSPDGEKPGVMVNTDGEIVYKALPNRKQEAIYATGKLPDEYDYAVLSYSQVSTGDAISQEEAKNAARASGKRGAKKSKSDGKPTPKATFLRQIAEDNYLFLDESHTAAGESNTGYYLQSIVRTSKAVTFASATFAKRPDTMPLYAIRTAMSQANVKPNELIGIIQKGGVTLQEIMSRALTEAGQMVRRERDMSDVQTDWETISDPATVKRARENYDKTIEAFNAIIRFQELYIKPLISQLDSELAEVASTAKVKKGTDEMGVKNTPFASKTYNYTKQLMLALKVDAIVDKVIAEIKAGRHPVIALESTMEASIRDYSPGDIISEPTFSASLLRGLETVMQYTVTDAEGKDTHRRYLPSDLGPEGEKAYYELQDFIRESTSDIFISPLDAIIERLRQEGYKVGELTGRNQYVERNDEGKVVVKRRTDKDKKRMQREFNSGELDVLILNKSASTGISLHASERFSDQRQRTMVIAQPLSDINDYMQMIGRIDRTGQVHRGYYINLGLPVPAENRFLMMLATKLKSLNANTTTSQESESNSVEAPDLLNKYGSQVVVEYLRDNPEIYVKMGEPIKEVTVNQLDDYTPPENDEVVRRISGYVALLSTKEQEEFYNDVVRRYNDLIKYLDDTGQNDLKITVMPLRAKTIERKVSSQGVDPNGTNPFAKDAFVETVEIDVLRKPMKADEVRKAIESLNTPKGTEKGHFPTAAADKTFGDRVLEILGIVQRETQAKLRDEEKRYEESKKIALEDIAKKSDKIRAQQKLSAEEKEQAIADYVAERNAQVEQQHERAVARIQEAERTMQSRLGMFVAGSSYLMPDQLNDAQLSSPELASPAIFLGYKAKESKVTPSTTFAVFATLDGRRRIELKLSDAALFTIRNMTRENYDLANRVTLDNWDSELPTSTRKNAIIMTGNILQAVSDTQDQNGNYPGQLISYTDENGDVHDGILMPDKWKPTMMKNSGVPINARLSQIEQGKSVASTDGKVTITKSRWSGSWLLTVPKSRKEGAVYFENPVILKVVGGFWQNRGQFSADINSVEDLRTVVNELANIGVKVTGEQNGGVELSVSNNDRSSIENTESQRIAFEAATTALARAGYEVVRATEEDIENLKKENKLLRKINGTINGWLGKDGRIYLTESGLNAETAVHEYTHLWAEALQLNDPGLWNEIKKLLKGTPTWNEVKNNPAYAKYDEDRLAEEVLAHLSGRDNGARMEAEAKRMIDEADTMADAAKAASMLNRLKEALKKFWTWVGKNLFGIKGKIDLDTVENMILADLVNGVNPFGPSGGRKKNTTEQSFTPAQPQNRIADEYNRMTGANVDDVNSVKRGWEKFARDQFDGLRPLEQMQQLIEKALGRKLRDSEKAYELATQLTSKTGQQIEREQLSYLVPVLQQVTDVIKALKGADGYPRDEAYEKVTNYMLAKHGLERNEWFEKQGKDEGDYAGLRGLAERLGYNPDDYKTAAEVTVRDMEDIMKVAGIDVNEFWKTVNALTNRMLEISYESGMIDKDTYEELKKRHKYYVPLRGFADGTAADLFDYVTQSPHFQNIFKKATGRNSMADDPLANLMSMLHSAIVIGNQNEVMQKIYNMAVNSKSDLLRVTKPWYVYDDTTDTWEEKYPDIPEDATADDIDAIVKQFDADMQQKQQQGKAKRKLNRIDVGKKLLPYQAREHEMVAYIDGKRVVMHVAGNPLVAQAMNRSNTQQLNKVMQAVQTATRWYSSINTSWSPAFGPKNAMRDIRMMLFGAYVTGGIRKMWQSSKDVVKAGWALPRLLVTGKMDGGLVKALGPQKAAQLEQWWNEFIENGGETGFTRTLNAEKAKGEVRDMIRHMLNGSKDGENRVRKYTIGLLEWIGRYSEDISRFAAYCQQRAQGESVLSSIQEAKNVTVNFNVKGGSDLAANMRAMYSFFNASMQGINRMRRLATEHPKRFSAGIAAMMLGGAVLPWLNMALFAMLGGDDDDWRKYEELSEYTANHNMIIYVGNHKFVSIPWSQELAPFNALGNIWFRQQMGWNKGKSVAEQWGDMFVDLSPVSVASGKHPMAGITKTIFPSFTTPLLEIGFNEDFTGSPLYKDNQWNKYDAAWEKAYTGKTSQSVIDASKWLYENVKVPWNGKKLDINPAIAEHLFSGVLGGMGRSGDKLLRYFTNGFQLQDAPFIRTMMFDSKKQGYIGAVQREYGRNAYEVLPEMKAKAEKADAMEFARLVDAEEYKIADVVSKYKTGKDLEGNKTGEVGIDKMEKEYKKIAGMSDGSEEYREQLEEIRNNITERKMEMLDEIQQVKYENSGDLRRYIMDVVNEVERKSKDKNGD